MATTRNLVVDVGEQSMKNVLLITVDSLRFDYVFGSNAPVSLEHLPALERRGVSFTNAFSDAPYTKQSFLSILSGTKPWSFQTVETGFDPERPHIAEILSEAGYATAGFHTNTYLNPIYGYDRGFDFYLGRDQSNSSENRSRITIRQLVERGLESPVIANIIHHGYAAAGRHLGVQLGSSLYSPADELNESAVQWSQQSDVPQFLWIHYMDVHNPYYPHEGTVSEDIDRRKAIKLFHRVNELRGDAPQEEIDILEQLYRGEIEYFDQQLGILFDQLEEILSLEETILVFTSDHGEAFNEKGRVFHPGSALFDENIHIPLIVAGPEIEPATVSTPVTNADLIPTILGQLKIELDENFDGTDITEFIHDQPEKRLVYTQSYDPTDGNLMVTDGRFKLIRDLATGRERLFDRNERPKELRDCQEEFRTVHGELSAALDHHHRTATQEDHQAERVAVGENVRLQLRKLGYDE